MDNPQRQEQKTDIQRRKFLSQSATIAGLSVVAPGVTLIALSPAHGKPANEPVTSSKRWGMLIDANKCADNCDICVQACRSENGVELHDRPATDPQWIRKVKVKDPITQKTVSLPIMCQHCKKPTCVDVCPTGASFTREDGITLVDRHICIGCRYCMMAGPYKARSFVHEVVTDQKQHMPRGKGCVEGCTFCVHRVDTDDNPVTACVEACNKLGHKAMVFGDLNDPESEINKQLSLAPVTEIRSDLRLDLAVRYRGI